MITQLRLNIQSERFVYKIQYKQVWTSGIKAFNQANGQFVFILESIFFRKKLDRTFLK